MYLRLYFIILNSEFVLKVRFVHVNTSAALAVTGRQLPEWANFQIEVVADVMIEQENTVFNVEEHRYTKSDSLRRLHSKLNVFFF